MSLSLPTPGGSAETRSVHSLHSLQSALSGQVPPVQSHRGQHRRNMSDTSAISLLSYSSEAVQQPPAEVRACVCVCAEPPTLLARRLRPPQISPLPPQPVVFLEDPPPNLICMKCGHVFTDPVIANCGHTFCRACVMTAPPGEVCPAHSSPLGKQVIPNLNVRCDRAPHVVSSCAATVSHRG